MPSAAFENPCRSTSSEKNWVRKERIRTRSTVRDDHGMRSVVRKSADSDRHPCSTRNRRRSARGEIVGHRLPWLIGPRIEKNGDVQFIRQQHELRILGIIQFELQILRSNCFRDGFLRFSPDRMPGSAALRLPHPIGYVSHRLHLLPVGARSPGPFLR